MMIAQAKGQAVLESVLMMVVIFAIWFTVTGALKNFHVFEKVFGTPWQKLTNTMEFGMPVANKTQAGVKHPASFDRHTSKINE